MKRVGFLLFDQLQLLDVSGPMDALDSANQHLARHGGEPAFELVTIALSRAAIKSESGLTLSADYALSQIDKLDWLIIPGGKGARELIDDEENLDCIETMAWIKAIAQSAERIISICTGAYVLAESGLLDGKRCCSHWRFIDDLAQRFPAVNFEAEPLFIVEEQMCTSGGLTAGIDLTLHLIQQEMGKGAAQETARDLVMYLRRSGDQSQFATPLSVQSSDRRLQRLQQWLINNLDKPITVQQMAEFVSMSERHFRRVFNEHMRLSPKDYLQQLKLEHARDLLISSSMQIEQIAQSIGITHADIFRRVFKKRFGLSPSEYRHRF